MFFSIHFKWKTESSLGKAERLAYLLTLLGLSSVPDTTRYQFLHRTASAIIEGQRFSAAHAVMLVHSFSQSDVYRRAQGGRWFADVAKLVPEVLPTSDGQIYRCLESAGSESEALDCFAAWLPRLRHG